MKKYFMLLIILLSVLFTMGDNNFQNETITVKLTGSNSSGGDTSVSWVNIGEDLPEAVDYSNGKLLNNVRPGDIYWTPNGSNYGLGNTGHVAMIEGVFWSKKFNQYYIRTIEANMCGVKRGCLTPERFREKGGGLILRVPDKYISEAERIKAVEFCIKELDKKYSLLGPSVTTRDDWYCSLLVWAAYFDATNHRINLDSNNVGMVTPDQITLSEYVEKIGITYSHIVIRKNGMWVHAHHVSNNGLIFYDEECNFERKEYIEKAKE